MRRFINSDAARYSYTDPDINTQARADALSKYADAGQPGRHRRLHRRRRGPRRRHGGAGRASEAEQQDAIAQLEDRRAALEREFERLEALEAERQEAERKPREAAARAAARSASRERASSSERSAPSGPIVSAPIGGIICPVQGPVAFSDTWGAPRSGGRAHKGVDMLSPTGTPTVAPVSGTVTHRGNSIGGLSWHLNGDNGHYYYGTHLSAYANRAPATSRRAPSSATSATPATPAAPPTSTSRSTPTAARAVNPYPAVAAAC